MPVSYVELERQYNSLRGELCQRTNEVERLHTEIAEQKKTIKEQGESIGALMAKGISDCTARDKRIEELEKRVVQANTDVRALPRYSYHNGDYYTAVIPLTPVFDILDALASPTTGEQEPVDKIKEVCEDLFLKLSTVKKVTVDRGITVSIETDTDNERDLEVIYDTELVAYDRLPGQSIEFKVVPVFPTGDDTEGSNE